MNTLSAGLILLPILAISLEDNWRQLGHVTHDRDYRLYLRDGTCQDVQLKSVSADDLTFKTGSPAKRSAIVRISESTSGNPLSIVFSGRSSWLDVRDVSQSHRAQLRVISKQGAEWNAKDMLIDQDSIQSAGKTLAKADVRYVQYIRFKPLTHTESYLDTESAPIFAPRLWFGGAWLGKLTVLLYAADLAEDNSSVMCQPRP